MRLSLKAAWGSSTTAMPTCRQVPLPPCTYMHAFAPGSGESVDKIEVI